MSPFEEDKTGKWTLENNHGKQKSRWGESIKIAEKVIGSNTVCWVRYIDNASNMTEVGQHFWWKGTFEGNGDKNQW